MSRRRQRGAAYRARRSMRSQVKAITRAFGPCFEPQTPEQILADIEATRRYIDWLTPRVATGAMLDELEKLTPVSEEEIRARVAARGYHIEVGELTDAQRAKREAPPVTLYYHDASKEWPTAEQQLDAIKVTMAAIADGTWAPGK